MPNISEFLEETYIRFDQIAQKLPYLLFKESNSRVTFFINIQIVITIQSGDSIITIRRLAKIIFFSASMVLSVFDRAIRTSIVCDNFSAFLKPVILHLNLCAAHSRLAKRLCQHIKYPFTLNLTFTQNLIQFL